jgi:uncharacterized protein Veg
MVRGSSVIPESPQHKKKIITRSSKMRKIKKEIKTSYAGEAVILTASINTEGDYFDTRIIKIDEFPAIYVRNENKYYWSPCQIPQLMIESYFKSANIVIDLLKLDKNFDIMTKINDAVKNNQLDKITLSIDRQRQRKMDFPITKIANTQLCGPGIINTNDPNSSLEPWNQ